MKQFISAIIMYKSLNYLANVNIIVHPFVRTHTYVNELKNCFLEHNKWKTIMLIIIICMYILYDIHNTYIIYL